MSKLDEIMDQVDEMFTWFAYERRGAKFDKLAVSPPTMSELLKATGHTTRYMGPAPSKAGFSSIRLQTSFGELIVEIDRTIPNNDIVLRDSDGNCYSYMSAYIDEMAEKILLGGSSVEDTSDR